MALLSRPVVDSEFGPNYIIFWRLLRSTARCGAATILSRLVLVDNKKHGQMKRFGKNKEKHELCYTDDTEHQL